MRPSFRAIELRDLDIEADQLRWILRVCFDKRRAALGIASPPQRLGVGRRCADCAHQGDRNRANARFCSSPQAFTLLLRGGLGAGRLAERFHRYALVRRHRLHAGARCRQAREGRRGLPDPPSSRRAPGATPS